MLRGLLVGFATMMAAACGDSSAAPTPVAGGTFASSHFSFRYTPLDGANISDIAASLEREYSRILADLGVDAMPTVNVTLYTDHGVMEAATRAAAGVIPSSASMSTLDNTRVYEVGYSVAEFVVARWGQRGLVDLIATNGDTISAVELPQSLFEQDWFTFARQRYAF